MDMARLNKTSPAAATRQLHTDSLASQTQHAPPSSAVHGASLLTAARHTKPTAPARPAKGKLARPTQKPVIATKKPAIRSNMYDLPDSPVKGPFQLPQTVNPAPLKVRRKNKRAEGDGIARSEAFSDLQVPQSANFPSAGDQDEQQIPTSPPTFAQDTNNNVPAKEHHRNSNKRRLDVEVDPRDRTFKSPRIERSDTSAHLDRQKALSSPLIQNHKSRPSRRSHPEIRIPIRDAMTHFLPTEGGATGERSDNSSHESGSDTISVAVPELFTASDQSKLASASNAQKDSLPETMDDEPMQSNRSIDNETESNEVFEIQQELEGDKQNREIASSRRAQTSTSAPSASLKNKKTKPIPVPKTRTEDNDGPDLKKASEEDATLTDLDRVFNFLDSDERPGKCQTKLATQIKRVCDRACLLISGETNSIDVVVEHSDNIRAMLGAIGSLGEDKRVAFKLDAYSFLFRALILYLEAAHGCLSKYYDEVTESLPAMQMLHSLVKNILAFKTRIATWNAPVPQYRNGDRLIKDVDSKLIVPLRNVERIFCIQLNSLEVAERTRQMRLELERKHEEEIARQDYLAARKERRNRWQDLHIARMQCEPDLYRRRKLFFREIDDLEEVDANGERFERIQLFKDRVMPRASLSTLEQREWTDEQTVVLIAALEKFAGPRVFEKLFHAHCGPDGALRDFTVTDITAKAAWVRSAYLKLHQEQQDKGWEVPDWVKQIPVLP